eukprot:Nitzschia sp. Nitz4//scaffold35_size145790//88102//89655//NITZ4_003035-RA/size145790-processed-gene-0.57-mRNA-1//1//CDS//3329549139//623//frame0
MSQVYATEPQTTGRVILETTHGPLEINLWSRECPTTTQYFLQLCLDGFYDGMLFHRIVPNFLIQTGAMRLAAGGSAANSKGSTPVPAVKNYGDLPQFQAYRNKHQAEQALERRRYELNSRLRFNHRGQVAMALEISSDDTGTGPQSPAFLQPQFFVTLEEAAELDGKHVCFGTITGPTFFNALRIGRTDCDESTYQPSILEEAPRIVRVKIVDNPIHSSLVPSTMSLPWKESQGDKSGTDLKAKKKKRKGVKNLNVLSFGDEMDEGEAIGGIKSSHDVIKTKKISEKVDKSLEKAVHEDEPREKPTKRLRAPTGRPSEGVSMSEENEEVPQPPVHVGSTKEAAPVVPPLSPKDVSSTMPPKKAVEPADTQPTKAPKMSAVEARRAKYAKKKADKRVREEDTMSKFLQFQKKVRQTAANRPASGEDPSGADEITTRLQRATETKDNVEDPKPSGVTYHGQVLENDDDVDEDWMKTAFKCRKHQDLDAKLGNDSLDDYKVIDEGERRKGKSHRDTRKRF